MAKVVASCPSVLGYSIEGNLSRKSVFSIAHFSGQHVCNMIVCNPLRFELQLQPLASSREDAAAS